MTVKKRGKFYHYEFMEGGKRYYGCFNGKDGKPIAEGIREAKEFEFKEKLRVRHGSFFEEQERKELADFATFVDKVYLPFAREHHASPKHDEFRCEVLKKFFKGKRFGDITMMSVVGFINVRLKSQTIRRKTLEDGTKVNLKRSPTTVRKELTLLSSICIMAIRQKVASSNPCDEVPKSVKDKIPARRKRKRFLSLEEEEKLFGEGLSGRRGHIKDLSETALYSGMRKSEMLRLKANHVNLGTVPLTRLVGEEALTVSPGWLIIEKSKNGSPRTIPMSQRVRRILERLITDATCGEFVFRSIRTGMAITEIKRAFVLACRAAEIENFTFHDLRHTWSTRAAEMGVVEHVRRDILGHKPKSMTDDYTHATPEAMEQAMELVAGFCELRQNSGKTLEAVRK